MFSLFYDENATCFCSVLSPRAYLYYVSVLIDMGAVGGFGEVALKFSHEERHTLYNVSKRNSFQPGEK